MGKSYHMQNEESEQYYYVAVRGVGTFVEGMQHNRKRDLEL
jgi:hypothetical protein